jgi:hypothetical protein
MEMYKGKHNKTYIAGRSSDGQTVLQAAKKHFKTAESNLLLRKGYVVSEDLYLVDPNIDDAVPVWVAYTKGR